MTSHPATVLCTTCNSPLGELLLAATDAGLCGLWYGDQDGIPGWALAATRQPDHPILRTAVGQLADYFAGRRQGFDIPIHLSGGTAFQRLVWQALGHLPWGVTWTYAELAARIGRPKAVRAVGGAVGRNPLGIVLPCHRVLGTRGALTGYTGGLHRKRALLALEGLQPSPM